MVTRARAAAIGLGADLLLGDPPDAAHPVAWFGNAMAAWERRGYRDSRRAGAVHAAVGAALGIAAGGACRSTAAATAVSVAGHGLRQAAGNVAARLAEGNLAEARALLPTLVGRDPSGLDADDIARAAVESVAENTVDAVVAPVFWAVTAGAPGVLAHRAVNTMDAMIGYRDNRYNRYGWAAARLDDAAAWLPARLTALLVAGVRPASARRVFAAVRRDAPAHPSPNSGVAEAAFAAALGVRLGGPSRYGDRTEQRPQLGTGRSPTHTDIARACELSRDVTIVLAVALAASPTLRGKP
jgi:adenosylcobinamide-phosphate synthase